jgi:hypothetical protein
MASGTADLQRDLGGAVMQSIFGALLTAGYASAASSQIAASNQSVSDNVAGQLTKSFDGAEAIARSIRSTPTRSPRERSRPSCRETSGPTSPGSSRC